MKNIFKEDVSKTFLLPETSCVRLEVELDSDTVVAEEQMETAVKCGVDVSNQGNPIEAKKYVFSFIRFLLLQREKFETGLLNDYLDPGIITMWKEVLSTLESSNRKVVDVKSGSLIFTLFCPTTTSKQELKNDSWMKSLTLKMENLVKKIG